MTDEKKPESTSTMTGPSYRMKVRAKYKPFHYCGVIIGQEWQDLPLWKEGNGVSDSPEHELTYTHSFHAAIALSAWFMNEAKLMAEVKLVKYKMVVKQELWNEGEMPMEDAVSFMFKESSAPTSKSEP